MRRRTWIGPARGKRMPTLLELQRAISRSLVDGDDGPAVAHILADGLPAEARFAIYRNTVTDKLTTALKLGYPAVRRLVGAEFFDAAARLFIEQGPPRCADLNTYGEDFADFLADFPPAAALPYLAGVARLEWAVAGALNAPDIDPVDLLCLAKIDAADQGRIAFLPHPAVRLVAADHPVDAVWRAVLAQDDAAMAAIDLGAGPVRLLVERVDDGVNVLPLGEPEWRFAAALFASHPVAAAIAGVPEVEPAAALAAHLMAGRFTGFALADTGVEVER